VALRRSKKVVVDDRAVEGPGRVLVVHDDPDGCELLVRILAVAGHEVQRAHDFGEMSDRLVERPAPHCVVLDINTGGIGGNLKLLDAVRGHRDPEVAAAQVVLVATTASSAMFSWQAGIDGFVLRPFHADELIGAVADALERPEDDRRQHRRRMLDQTRAGGRRLPVVEPAAE
jgi:DNA-binding NtrC family response regulator